MRKSNFVLAAAAILAASAASSAARADALPKEVLRSWCPDTDDGSHTSYKSGKCEDSDSKMTVKPNSVTYWESGCTFSSITTRTQTLFDATYRRPTVSKVFEVKARCSGEGVTWNSTLFFNPLGHGALEHQGWRYHEHPRQVRTIVRTSILAMAVACCASACTKEQRAGCMIKGNISSSGERIYHVPGQRYYDKTLIHQSKGERWFCTEQEAVGAGWRKAKV